MSDPVATFQCSVNSVPFWQKNTSRRSVDAAYNLCQQRYIDSLLSWQSKITYNCKALFSDKLTFQFKTQKNSDVHVETIAGVPDSYTYTNPAKFHVLKSKIGSNGFPIPDDNNIVSGFESLFNPTYGTIVTGGQFWGIQDPNYDTFNNPLTSITQQLVTYMWSFSFGDVLSQTGGDSGIYFLRFDNYDDTNTLVDVWYSEPILLFGNEAYLTPQTQKTLLFQGQNFTNKSDILINAISISGDSGYSPVLFWFNNPNLFPIFNCRVEADILEYEPKGIYKGFYQENWLQQNTFTSSWETFLLNVGSNTNGIPTTLFRIISKYIELDYFVVNNQLYMYDFGLGGDSPSNAWKMKKPRVKGLIGGSLPIRYKYPNQLFINPLIDSYRIFTEEFDPTFS